MADEPRLIHGEYTVTRVYDAPRELVWRMWTEPEHLTRWWGPAGMHTPLETIEVDLRPGGAFRFVMITDDERSRFPSDMVVREVTPPELLVLEWEAQRHLGPGALAVTFTELGARTRVRAQFSGWQTAQMLRSSEDAWHGQLQKLADILATREGTKP